MLESGIRSREEKIKNYSGYFAKIITKKGEEAFSL